MARFTPATGAGTNPYGLFATVIALIDDKIWSMLLAIGLGSCISVGQALTAN